MCLSNEKRTKWKKTLLTTSNHMHKFHITGVYVSDIERAKTINKWK